MTDQTIFIDPNLLGLIFTLGLFYLGHIMDERKVVWQPILYFMTVPVALATGVHFLGVLPVFGISWWIGIFMFMFAILLSMGGLYYALHFGREKPR